MWSHQIPPVLVACKKGGATQSNRLVCFADLQKNCERTKGPQCSTMKVCVTPCYSALTPCNKVGRRYVVKKAIFLRKFTRTMKHSEALLSLHCGACNPQKGRCTVNMQCYFAVLKYDVHLLWQLQWGKGILSLFLYGLYIPHHTHWLRCLPSFTPVCHLKCYLLHCVQ